MSFTNLLLLGLARQSRRLYSDMFSIYTDMEARQRQSKSNIVIDKQYIPKMYILCKNIKYRD